MLLERAGLVTAIVLATTSLAYAQGLPGLPPQPSPVEQKPDCSEKGVKAMEQQLEQLEAIDRTAPETIGLFCTAIDALTRWMDWKDDEPLPPAINDLAKDILKQNITPRMVKAMCRQAQGDAGRNTRTEIGTLKARLQTCKGV